jgi:hypothetical protein
MNLVTDAHLLPLSQVLHPVGTEQGDCACYLECLLKGDNKVCHCNEKLLCTQSGREIA